jgi:hypothetical protein
MTEFFTQIYSEKKAAENRAVELKQMGWSAAVSGPIDLVNHFGPNDQDGSNFRAPAGTQWWVVIGSRAAIDSSD